MLYLDAATGQVEHDTSMALLEQTWTYGRDFFNACYRFFGLPIRPATEIVEITYVDEDGNPITWDAAEYRLDLGRNQVILQPDFSWPAVMGQGGGQIEVSFIAGYDTPANVPAELRQAVALQAGKWVANPQMDMPQGIGDDAYDRLVARYMRSDYP